MKQDDMENKVLLQDIALALSKKRKLTNKEAEAFLKVFFRTIIENVIQEKSVKIKGIGTFKLIEVLDRESVDVNTGERIIIPGHSKVGFTPDNELKNKVNKPFELFQAVIINENTSLADMEALPEGADEGDENSDIAVADTQQIPTGIQNEDIPSNATVTDIPKLAVQETMPEDESVFTPRVSPVDNVDNTLKTVDMMMPEIASADADTEDTELEANETENQLSEMTEDTITPVEEAITMAEEAIDTAEENVTSTEENIQETINAPAQNAEQDLADIVAEPESSEDAEAHNAVEEKAVIEELVHNLELSLEELVPKTTDETLQATADSLEPVAAQESDSSSHEEAMPMVTVDEQSDQEIVDGIIEPAQSNSNNQTVTNIPDPYKPIRKEEDIAPSAEEPERTEDICFTPTDERNETPVVEGIASPSDEEGVVGIDRPVVIVKEYAVEKRSPLKAIHVFLLSFIALILMALSFFAGYRMGGSSLSKSSGVVVADTVPSIDTTVVVNKINDTVVTSPNDSLSENNETDLVEAETDAMLKAEEAKKQAEAHKLQEEARTQAEIEKKKAEEAKKQAEAQKLQAEAKKQAEIEKKKAEEAKKQAEAAKIIPKQTQGDAKNASKFEQVNGGEYLIVGTLKTRAMKVGDNLYKFSREELGDKELVRYIIVHNAFPNPDNIPLGYEVKIPKLVKKK